MSTPYSISLLNDLHNHFPDLLYQPQRFRSVPDVLNYVISVANQNPFERERNAYQQAHTAHATHATHATRAAPASANSTAATRNNRPIEETANEYYQILHGARLPETDVVFTSRSTRPQILGRSLLGRNWMGGDSSTDTLLTNLIGQMFEAPSLHNFLDQSVTVHPTADQIHHYTTLTNAPRNMDDNCAICQDPIEQGQQMRILNYCTHSFHATCIDTWFTTHVTCPTCRHDIRNNNS
jgi:Ring finger domain